MNETDEAKMLKLARKKQELLEELLAIAEQQRMFQLGDHYGIYNELMDQRNKCFEKLKKTDVKLQCNLRQKQVSDVLGKQLEAINRDSAETIRKILAIDELNKVNLAQAMEMIKDKKGSLKANKTGIVKYYKTVSHPITGVHTDSKG